MKSSEIRVNGELGRVDWVRAKVDLARDDFDNGRSPRALEQSFRNSAHVALAWDGDELVGMARSLSDGVCNAYVVDVWTKSTHRRRGVGTAMMEHLLERVPGQHVGLQTDSATSFYSALGFVPQPEFLSRVSGSWLENDANC